METKSYRDALGKFATGVAVVTAQTSDGAPIGRTINSFVSISLDPPLVGWCLDNASQALSDFDGCESFAINFLSEEQQSAAMSLSKSGQKGLSDFEIDEIERFAPVLPRALAWLVCEKHDRLQIGDHVMYVGRVVRHESDFESQKVPLIFYSGKFRQT